MSKHHHGDGSGDLHFEQISHHGVRYEPRDLGGRGIIVFLIILVVSSAVLCAVVWGFYRYHIGHLAEELPATGIQIVRDMPQQPPPTRFPKPTLQPDDVADMYNMRANEDQILNSYGWVDQNAGVAHIPVDDAMKALAKQGLPTRPAPQLAPSAHFGSGTNTVPGMAGGTRPVARQ